MLHSPPLSLTTPAIFLFFLHPLSYLLLLCKLRSKATLLHEAKTQISAEARAFPIGCCPVSPPRGFRPRVYFSAAPDGVAERMLPTVPRG